jgi:hypothetical protein
MELRDTTFIQLASVAVFGKAVGYVFNGRSFVREDGKHFVSFEDMQRFHNGPVQVNSIYVRPLFNRQYRKLDKEGYHTGMKMKLVYHSKLQWVRAKRAFVAQSHKIVMTPGTPLDWEHLRIIGNWED